MSGTTTLGKTAQVENPDSENADVIITDVPGERQDEYQVKWDYDKNPVYVYDFEENQAYPPSAPVVGVVYLESVKARCEGSWALLDIEDIQEMIENGPLKEYHIPEPRISSVD